MGKRGPFSTDRWGAMDGHTRFKARLQRRVETLEEIIHDMEKAGLAESATVSRWRMHLEQAGHSLEDSILRIAVVGSVKSGKSTLINALVGRDLLKRGAGIITAFITRLRSGDAPGGWVELKPWSQIHNELNETLHTLPFLHGDAPMSPVDIRKSEDRRRLSEWIEQVRTEWQQPRGQLDPGFLLLKGYLDGYPRLHENMGESVNRLIFDERTLPRHQEYVGYEGQAAFVRDMEIHYPVPWLGDQIEIADCQGNDSPNPLHFALVQQYLFRCHFVFFVINSRTGLREADFKLLDFLRTLRMLRHTIFVLNADLDAHGSRSDLDALVGRVERELSWVAPSPHLHVFSALFHLVDRLGDAASERERLRLDLWRQDKGLVATTESGFQHFREHIAQRLSNQRLRVVLGSGLSRINLVAGSILDTARTGKRFLDAGTGDLQQSTDQLKRRQESFQDILKTLENAISGTRESLRQELDREVERFFDLEHGPIVRETLDMVEHYRVDALHQESLGDYRRMFRQLHWFYMEFRQSLSRYLVEKVNLRIIELARQEEAFLAERLRQSSRAFGALFATAMDRFRRDMAQQGIELRGIMEMKDCDWSLLNEITPPSFSAFVDHGALGRGVLLMKFGLGRITRLLTTLKSRIGRPELPFSLGSGDDQGLREAVSLVKSEAGTELLHAFLKYRKVFREEYLHRMLEAGARHLMEELKERVEMAEMDFAGLLHRSETEGKDREIHLGMLHRAIRITGDLVEEMDGLRCAMDLDQPVPPEDHGPEESRISGPPGDP